MMTIERENRGRKGEISERNSCGEKRFSASQD
jgi:hypothetical protein